MKVIFLDVDGVLNNHQSGIDADMMERLAKIVEKTDAKIVLSSSWKNGWNKEKVKWSYHYIYLNKCLNEYGLEIYDRIPNYHNLKRQDEIKIWLKDHPEVTNFVILDDETTHLMDFVGKELVKTSKLPDGVMLKSMDEATGLQDEHVTKAIGILMKKEK